MLIYDIIRRIFNGTFKMKKTSNIEYYLDSQAAIEQDYLIPLSGQPKSNLKNGKIERDIHGAQHVGRASIWVTVLHQLFKEHFPEYTSKALQLMNEQFGLNEKEVIDLTRYAVICHDSKRQGEGTDRWEKQSADNLYQHLISKGFDPNVCDFFRNATSYKDNTYQFIRKSNLPFNTSANYVRKLIALADCADIQRCTGSFKFKAFMQKVSQLDRDYKDLKAYNTKQHDPIFLEFLINVHNVIFDQGDMLFDQDIIAPKGYESSLAEMKKSSNFDLERKLQFEHANNVVSALTADILENHSYFKRFLEDELLLDTELADVIPAFDPLVHVTQASMLVMLEKHNFSIDSPRGMILNGLAPLTGEQSVGGGSYTIDDSPYTCFYRLSAIDKNFKRHVERYSSFSHTQMTEQAAKEAALDSLKDYLQKCRDNAYTYINSLMVYLIRAKNFGATDKELQSLGLDCLLSEYR